MKKIKFTNTRLFKILRVLIVIVALIIIVKLAGKLFNKKDGKLSLIIGDQRIDLKYELIVDDSKNIYMSKQDISNIYDSNIYYDKSEKMVITTSDKSVAKLILEKTTMEVNSTEMALKGTAKEIDGMLYLPLLDLNKVYEFEYEYNEEENVLMIDSMSHEKKEAVVLKNAKVKENTKFFSKTLEKIKKTAGEYVVILGNEGDYTKVRTSKGNIGYIKTKYLSETKTVRENMEHEELTNLKILEEYNIVSASNEPVTLDNSYLNVVVPNLFNINENFELEDVIDLTKATYEKYFTWAEENHITMGATVTLDGSMSALYGSYSIRTCLINNMYNEFVNNKLKIICIDFNNVDDKEGLYRFLIELTPRFKETGYNVIVKYKDGLNREKLENIVDCVVD